MAADALGYQKINTLDTVEDMPSFLEKQVATQRTIVQQKAKQQEEAAKTIGDLLESEAKNAYLFNDAYKKEFGKWRDMVIDKFQKNQNNVNAVRNDSDVLRGQINLENKVKVGQEAQNHFDKAELAINAMKFDNPADKQKRIDDLNAIRKDVVGKEDPFKAYTDRVGEITKLETPPDKPIDAIKEVDNNINALKEKGDLSIEQDPNSVNYGKYVSQVPPQLIKASIIQSFSNPLVKADAIDKYNNAIKGNDALKTKYMDLAKNDPYMNDPAMQFMYEPHAPVKKAFLGTTPEERDARFEEQKAFHAGILNNQNIRTSIYAKTGGGGGGTQYYQSKEGAFYSVTKGKINPVEDTFNVSHPSGKKDADGNDVDITSPVKGTIMPKDADGKVYMFVPESEMINIIPNDPNTGKPNPYALQKAGAVTIKGGYKVPIDFNDPSNKATFDKYNFQSDDKQSTTPAAGGNKPKTTYPEWKKQHPDGTPSDYKKDSSFIPHPNNYTHKAVNKDGDEIFSHDGQTWYDENQKQIS